MIRTILGPATPPKSRRTLCALVSDALPLYHQIGAVVVAVGHLLIMVLMSATWALMPASWVVAMDVGFGCAALPTLVMNSVPVSVTAVRLTASTP